MCEENFLGAAASFLVGMLTHVVKRKGIAETSSKSNEYKHGHSLVFIENIHIELNDCEIGGVTDLTYFTISGLQCVSNLIRVMTLLLGILC